MKIEVPVFKSGDYSEWGYSNYTDEDLELIASRTNSFGVKQLQYFSDVYNEGEVGVPITAEHADTTGIINLGFADRFHRDGSRLMASLSIPDGVSENLNKKVKGISIEINPKNKIISRVTLTRDPLVSIAKFSKDAVEGINKNDAIELFSMTIAEEKNMAEETEAMVEEAVEETVEEVLETVEDTEEVEEVEEVVETVEEAVEETPEAVESVEETEEAMSETEALRVKLEILEKEMKKLREEKVEAEVESFSKTAVSKGVPPVIAKLLAPYIVKGESEAFSKEYGDFGKVAKKVMDFLTDDDAFKSKISSQSSDEYVRGEEIETYSAESIIKSAEKYCTEKNIEIGSEEYKYILASKIAKFGGK